MSTEIWKLQLLGALVTLWLCLPVLKDLYQQLTEDSSNGRKRG